MTDISRHEYDWRLWLSHINMTDSDLTKYDWRRQLGDGSSGVYHERVTVRAGMARSRMMFSLVSWSDAIISGSRHCELFSRQRADNTADRKSLMSSECQRRRTNVLTTSWGEQKRQTTAINCGLTAKRQQPQDSTLGAVRSCLVAMTSSIPPSRCVGTRDTIVEPVRTELVC